MTALEELTQKIHKHCPELLELTNGCEVRLTNINVKLGPFMMVNNDFRARDASGGYVDLPELDSWIERNQAENLGHPITLEHVLKAIEISHEEETAYAAHVFSDGQMFGKDGEYECRWTLGKPLSEQSPETIEWLNKIIV